MKKLLLLSVLFISCDNPENHGNLSIFEDTYIQNNLTEWLAIIDSVYIDNWYLHMVKVYKGSAKA